MTDINKVALANLSLSDLIAIPSRDNTFYGMDILQYEEMLKVVKREIHERVTNIFIF